MKGFFCLLWVMLGLQSRSQSITGVEVSHYVFPEFVKGVVLKKSGERLNALLNYNSLTEEVIFDQAGTKLALTQLQDVDTVFMHDRKFVPVGKVFYEVAPTAIPLFIQHKSEVVPPGNPTPFGSSQTTAITNLSNVKTEGGAYQLKLPDDYQITSRTVFYLRKDGNYYVIKNSKSLEELYPDKKEQIKTYSKDNKVDFKDYSSLTRLLSTF